MGAIPAQAANSCRKGPAGSEDTLVLSRPCPSPALQKATPAACLTGLCPFQQG